MYGAGKLLNFRKAIYDRLITELGYPNLEIVNLITEDAKPEQGEEAVSNSTPKEGTPDKETVAETEKKLDDEPGDVEQRSELLDKWKNKSIKRFKDKGTAQCDFDGLPLDLTESIHVKLENARSVQEIKDIFFEGK